MLPEAALAEVVDELRADLARLRWAVDQLRDELRFVVADPDRPQPCAPALRITSLPKDPAAADFFNRIDAVPEEQIAVLRAEVTRSTRQQTDCHPM